MRLINHVTYTYYIIAHVVSLSIQFHNYTIHAKFTGVVSVFGCLNGRFIELRVSCLSGEKTSISICQLIAFLLLVVYTTKSATVSIIL